LPSKNGKTEGIPFGDIININVGVSQNGKKTESLKKNLLSIMPSMSPVRIQTDVGPVVTPLRWTPTPVWKPMSYSLSFNATPVITVNQVTGNSAVEEYHTGNLTRNPISIVYRPTAVPRPSAIIPGK